MGEQGGQAGKSSGLPVSTVNGNDQDHFWLTGETGTGLKYGLVGRVIAPGGKFEEPEDASDGRLQVTDVEEIAVLIKVFADEDAESALTRLRGELDDLPDDYETLLKPHAESHGNIFNRCRITLEDGDDPETPNEDLLAEAYDGDVPDALLERMYHYMSFMDDYRENARKLYGASGILLPIVQTKMLWRGPRPGLTGPVRRGGWGNISTIITSSRGIPMCCNPAFFPGWNGVWSFTRIFCARTRTVSWNSVRLFRQRTSRIVPDALW